MMVIFSKLCNTFQRQNTNSTSLFFVKGHILVTSYGPGTELDLGHKDDQNLLAVLQEQGLTEEQK